MRFKDDTDEFNDFDQHLHDIDEYDEELIRLKHMINTRNTFSKKYHVPHNLAIGKQIFEIQLAGHDAGIPLEEININIEQALHGGKVRRLYTNEPNNDTVQIRSKKNTKAKPKRKPKKVVRKCKCKK